MNISCYKETPLDSSATLSFLIIPSLSDKEKMLFWIVLVLLQFFYHKLRLLLRGLPEVQGEEGETGEQQQHGNADMEMEEQKNRRDGIRHAAVTATTLGLGGIIGTVVGSNDSSAAFKASVFFDVFGGVMALGAFQLHFSVKNKSKQELDVFLSTLQKLVIASYYCLVSGLISLIWAKYPKNKTVKLTVLVICLAGMVAYSIWWFFLRKTRQAGPQRQGAQGEGEV